MILTFKNVFKLMKMVTEEVPSDDDVVSTIQLIQRRVFRAHSSVL